MFLFKKNAGHIGAVMQVDGTKENTKLTLPKKRKMPWNKISQDGAQKEKMDYYTGVTFTSNKGGMQFKSTEYVYQNTRKKLDFL